MTSLEQHHQSLSLPVAASLLPDDAADREVLEACARSLAEVRVDSSNSDIRPCLVLRLAQASYGITYEYLDEVIYSHGVVAIPGTPGHVVGLINLRGKLLAVYDLGSLISAVAVEAGKLARIVVVGNGEMQLGLLVDEVLGVGEFNPGELAEPVPGGNQVRTEYLKGIHAGELTLIALRQIFLDPELIVEHQS